MGQATGASSPWQALDPDVRGKAEALVGPLLAFANWILARHNSAVRKLVGGKPRTVDRVKLLTTAINGKTPFRVLLGKLVDADMLVGAEPGLASLDAESREASVVALLERVGAIELPVVVVEDAARHVLRLLSDEHERRYVPPGGGKAMVGGALSRTRHAALASVGSLREHLLRAAKFVAKTQKVAPTSTPPAPPSVAPVAMPVLAIPSSAPPAKATWPGFSGKEVPFMRRARRGRYVLAEGYGRTRPSQFVHRLNEKLAPFGKRLESARDARARGEKTPSGKNWYRLVSS